MTLNFATLPAGGGEVTITRHNSVPPAPPTYELPPGSAAYLPVWLEITSTIPDHAFAVEVTLDLSGVTGFDANSAVMFYNEITDSWIPMAGTYTAGSPNTFTFTATHFTAFGFVTKPTPSYNLFVGNTGDATSAGVKAPNNTWRSVTPPAGGYNGEDDWSWTGAQSVTFYLVPQTSTIFKAAYIMLEWDKSIMTYASTAFTGIPFSASSATLQGSEDQLLIHVEGSADITTDSYVAAITFTLLKPGHSPLLVIGSDFTKDPALSVFVTPYQGEVKAYLGDFATTTGPDYTQGDGKLDITDLSPWSSSYWSGVEGGPGMTNYKSKFDIGPTTSGYVYTLPTLDAKIDFEDLVVFSISYGLSKQYQLPKAPVESKEPLMIASGATTGAGAETRIPVTVSGGVVDLRAMSLVLSGRFGKFLGVEKGALLQPYATPVMLMSRTEGSRVYVDMAIMGSDVEALNGEGEVLVLRFDGKSTVVVTKADCRTSVNTAIATEIKDAPVAIPTSFGLSQNYPNPFNPSTVLEYQVPTPAQVEISVYNLLGEKVATLVNEVKEPGYHSITWNATGANGQTVATGIYFYRMHAGDFVSTKRMLLVK
ncbi:MAG: T9SS type A sorting domain-containing protein [Bacteroidetes bacterium]|nr:T9SS type A sorting domain-containing protein [Bacteroidota bacterium]